MLFHFSETQRIEVLINIEYGGKIRGYNAVCRLFNAKYADLTISPSSVCRIVHTFEETSKVRDLPNSGRTKTVTEIDRENIMLLENLHNAVRLIAQNADSVYRNLKCEKWKPYKVNDIYE